nr:PTS transporter subunit IIC [Mycoplasmopsis bovis]
MRCLLRCCFISYNQRNWCSYTKCWFCSWPPTNVWCFAIAYKIGKYFGKAEQSSENRKMPKGLKVFEDNIFTQAVLILLVFLILILIIQFAPGLERICQIRRQKRISDKRLWTMKSRRQAMPFELYN